MSPRAPGGVCGQARAGKAGPYALHAAVAAVKTARRGQTHLVAGMVADPVDRAVGAAAQCCLRPGTVLLGTGASVCRAPGSRLRLRVVPGQGGVVDAEARPRVGRAHQGVGRQAVAVVEAALCGVALQVAQAVTAPGRGAARPAGRHRPRGENALAPRVGEKVVRRHWGAEEDVVVEVEEAAGEAGDAVDVGLDGRRAEGGEDGRVRENVCVGHHAHPRVGAVQPHGDLAVGDDEHAADPGRVALQRAQRVAEFVAVAVPLELGVLGHLGGAPFLPCERLVVGAPLRV